MQFATKEDYLKHLENVKNVTDYIDYFSDDSQIFGEWKTTSFPSIHYSQEVHDFLDALHENGLIIPFDWTKWDTAETIFKDHSIIDTLKYIEIEHLLTNIVRKERFCEGILLSAIENGMMLKILVRLRRLYDVEENGLMLVDELNAKEENFKKHNEEAKKLLKNGMTFEPMYELSQELDLLEKIYNHEFIELNEFYITGLDYYEAKEFDFSDVKFLTLRLEPENDYDVNAIEAYLNKLKVGYVPKEENSLIAKMMKQGVDIIATIVNYNQEAPPNKKIKIRLYQGKWERLPTLKEMLQAHREFFGVEAYTIGMFWSDPESVISGIAEAFEAGKPYNEYLMLSEEERKAFDDGHLLF